MGDWILVSLWPGKLFWITSGFKGKSPSHPSVFNNHTFLHPSLICTPHVLLQMAAICWLYYFSKFIEMLDTVSHNLSFRFSKCLLVSICIHALPFCHSGFLCAEEEEQPGDVSSRLPSLHNALHLVVWRSICSRLLCVFFFYIYFLIKSVLFFFVFFVSGL